LLVKLLLGFLQGYGSWSNITMIFQRNYRDKVYG